MNAIKNRVLQLSLLTLISTPILADIHDRIEYKLNRVLRDVEIINNEIAAECTVIHPEDFEDADGNLTQTYVISTPGKYCLGGNVEFVPVDEFTPAIVILSDDVSLSLNGFTLSQANDTPNAYGVQIGQGYNYDDPDFVLKNITVFNGNITDFTAIGVFCYNGSFDGGAGELAFQDLHFFDLNILDCGSATDSFDFASGINLDSFAGIDPTDIDLPVAYKNVLINRCNANRCLGNGSINVFTVDNLFIENTNANDLLNEINNLGFVFAHAYYGSNIQMFNCQGNGVNALDPAAASSQCGGCDIESSRNVYVKDCQFNDFFGESAFIVNNNFSRCHNSIFENCQFNNARGGDLVVEVCGVHMSDDPRPIKGQGMKFINCQFNGASVSEDNEGGVFDWLVAGFLAFTLQDIVFEDCQACNIIANNPGFVSFGYWVATDAASPAFPFGNLQNLTFRNCIASDIVGNEDTVGFAIPATTNAAFGNQGSLTNTVLESCIAERIHSLSATNITAGIGEYSLFPPFIAAGVPRLSNLFIRDCRVSDVRAGEDNPLSAGILIRSVHNPVLQRNSVSDCDRGILFTGTDEIIPNGFQLAATLDDALAFPPVFIDLNTIPALAPVQDFFNITQGNSVSIAPDASTIDVDLDFILPAADLTALGWQPGDEIFYDCNGGSPISDLVCTTTYFLIVYIPGFSDNGVIQQNEVDNCSISGYQDDAPTTLSAWVDNTAFNDGTPASAAANYAITWAGVPPVDAGTLAAYPTPGSKYYNLSLIP